MVYPTIKLMKKYSKVHSISLGRMEIVFRRTPFTVGFHIGYTKNLKGRGISFTTIYEHLFKALTVELATMKGFSYQSLRREVRF